MDESWIGKVLFVGIIGAVIWGLTSLMQSKSEAARRARIVLGGVLALGVAWIIFIMSGPVGLLVVLAVIGAGVWIVEGSTK